MSIGTPGDGEQPEEQPESKKDRIFRRHDEEKQKTNGVYANLSREELLAILHKRALELQKKQPDSAMPLVDLMDYAYRALIKVNDDKRRRQTAESRYFAADPLETTPRGGLGRVVDAEAHGGVSEHKYGKPRGSAWDKVKLTQEATKFKKDLPDQQLWDLLMEGAEQAQQSNVKFREKQPEDLVNHIYEKLRRTDRENRLQAEREAQPPAETPEDPPTPDDVQSKTRLNLLAVLKKWWKEE